MNRRRLLFIFALGLVAALTVFAASIQFLRPATHASDDPALPLRFGPAVTLLLRFGTLIRT